VRLCGENSNELICHVEDRELNEWVSNWWLLRKDFCMTLIVVHCNDFDSYIGGNFQSSFSVIGFDESVFHSLS